MCVTLLKMKTSLSGPSYSVSPGDFRPFQAYEAKRLVAAEFAQDATEDEVKAFEAEHGPIGGFDDHSEQAKEPEDDGGAGDPADADAADAAQTEADADADAAADAAAATAPTFADLTTARAAYREVFDKGPGLQWSIEQIAAKIAEKQAQA